MMKTGDTSFIDVNALILRESEQKSEGNRKRKKEQTKRRHIKTTSEGCSESQGERVNEMGLEREMDGEASLLDGLRDFFSFFFLLFHLNKQS